MMKEQCLLPCLCVYRNMNVISPPHPTPHHTTPAVTDGERAVPVAVPACVCVCTRHERYYPTPPHPSNINNWWWKSCACVCRTARKAMSLPCLCVYRNMNVFIPTHPTPAVTDDERAVPVAVPVCTKHELYYTSHPTPPHPSSNWWWKSSACCRACVCTKLERYCPTPPHPTPPQQ